MKSTKRILVGATVATGVAVPAILIATGTSANADVERSGRCAGAEYQLGVDREHGGFEVEADIDDARPGSTWRVVLRHDGKVFTRAVRTADVEGDVSVDRIRPNTAGADTFRLRVTELASGKACSTKVVTR